MRHTIIKNGDCTDICLITEGETDEEIRVCFEGEDYDKILTVGFLVKG